MKSGFKEVIDKILGRYGLKTRDCVGTVWADGDWSWTILKALGYEIEKGISNPDYDYVIISKGKSNLENILTALTKIKTGCIIVYRVDHAPKLAHIMLGLNRLSSGLETSFYRYDEGKTLAVTLKGDLK